MQPHRLGCKKTLRVQRENFFWFHALPPLTYLAFSLDKLYSRYKALGGRGVGRWTRPICLKAGLQGEAHHRAIFIHYICVFTLLTGALSCGRFHLSVWCWLKEKAVIVLCGLQACFELRRVSQWRVGGRLNVRSTWPRSHSLMSACVWPLSLSPSNSVCLYPSVSSFSLCLRCVCHLVWLHICGYPVYKAWTAAAFVQRLFALSGTCHGLIHFTNAKEASPLTVSTVKHCMMWTVCSHVYSQSWVRFLGILKLLYRGGSLLVTWAATRCTLMSNHRQK